MTRGNDPGRDFDDQWHASRRAGERKAAKGEGVWAEDKYLKREARRLSGPPVSHRGESKGCTGSTVTLLAFLGGFAWAFDSTVRYLTP